MFEQYHLTTYEEGLYPVYRIPGTVVTAKGTVLAYFETRLQANDWSTRGVGLRRSVDQGQSWSPIIQLVETADEVAINNPVMIATRAGRVHFLWQEDYRRSFYSYSDDDGLSFSDPVEMTSTFETYREEYDWSLYALGPGHGIELSNGNLLIPVWLCRGEGNAHQPTDVSVIQSSDGGRTWQRGEIIYGTDEIINPNETTAVELSNGKVMLNMRIGSKQLCRATTISPNGLTDFSAIKLEKNLPDPWSFGSLARINVQGQTGIVFVNCDFEDDGEIAEGQSKPNNRNHLTVRLSLDDGKTWQYSREITHYAGYADMSVAPDSSSIYVFYEHGRTKGNWGVPEHLTVAKFDLDWLMGKE